MNTTINLSMNNVDLINSINYNRQKKFGFTSVSQFQTYVIKAAMGFEWNDTECIRVHQNPTLVNPIESITTEIRNSLVFNDIPKEWNQVFVFKFTYESKKYEYVYKYEDIVKLFKSDNNVYSYYCISGFHRGIVIRIANDIRSKMGLSLIDNIQATVSQVDSVSDIIHLAIADNMKEQAFKVSTNPMDYWESAKYMWKEGIRIQKPYRDTFKAGTGQKLHFLLELDSIVPSKKIVEKVDNGDILISPIKDKELKRDHKDFYNLYDQLTKVTNSKQVKKLQKDLNDYYDNWLYKEIETSDKTKAIGIKRTGIEDIAKNTKNLFVRVLLNRILENDYKVIPFIDTFWESLPEDIRNEFNGDSTQEDIQEDIQEDTLESSNESNEAAA